MKKRVLIVLLLVIEFSFVQESTTHAAAISDISFRNKMTEREGYQLLDRSEL